MVEVRALVATLVVASVACGGGDDRGAPASDATRGDAGTGGAVDDAAAPPRDAGADASTVAAPEPVDVALGARHSCAVVRYPGAKAPSFVTYCWGANDAGQLGAATGSGLAHVASAPTGLRALASHAAADATCGVDELSAVWCWGRNDAAQCAQTASPSATPARVLRNGALFASSRLVVGGASACSTVATSTGYALACWGRNTRCELGTSAPPCAPGATSEPVVGDALASAVDAVDVALGGAHGCAVLANGDVVCWGGNDDGAAGAGAATVSPPAPVGGAPGSATHVAAGVAFSCALDASKHALCWGDNRTGISSGDLVRKAAPAEAFGDAVSLAAGGGFVCAIATTGSVQCRGAGALGQLGRGATVDVGAPAPVAGLASVERLAAGGAHACAIVAETGRARRLLCWGDNSARQVDPDLTEATSPSPRELHFPSVPPT